MQILAKTQLLWLMLILKDILLDFKSHTTAADEMNNNNLLLLQIFNINLKIFNCIKFKFDYNILYFKFYNS